MTSKEARQVRFEAALELGVRKSNQEDQMSSKEACKARSEAPLELGAKDARLCSKSRRWIIPQINEDRQECQTPEGRKEESIAEG